MLLIISRREELVAGWQLLSGKKLTFNRGASDNHGNPPVTEIEAPGSLSA
jgi:hypothetical protein